MLEPAPGSAGARGAGEAVGSAVHAVSWCDPRLGKAESGLGPARRGDAELQGRAEGTQTGWEVKPQRGNPTTGARGGRGWADAPLVGVGGIPRLRGTGSGQSALGAPSEARGQVSRSASLHPGLSLWC